ncbi:HAD hydrolase-like protein [Actinoplanes sp. CA-030573]|uniref:HAD hydrolase-like protein n=1 Tax=Actinoplanes sp. CA-030573 TaxID=3239898 RepID=UPI003D8E2199
MFDELLAETGFRPEQCVYVGDSPGDALAAGGAGIRFIACLQSGVRRLDEFHPRHLTAAVGTFPEILPAIRALPLRGGGPGAARASSSGGDGRPR